MTEKESMFALKIYLDESDKLNGAVLYEQILLKARELNLIGATVFRGIAGYGSHKKIHTTKLLDISQSLPIMIEILDKKNHLEFLLHYLKEIEFKGVITLDPVNIIFLE